MFWYYGCKKNVKIFITGKGDSGKSYLANRIIKEILNREPDKKVYVISPYDEDESLDDGLVGVDGVEDVIERLQPEKYNLDLMENSIIVLDDIEGFGDSSIIADLYDMTKKIMQNGRHYETDIIFINHTPLDGMKTKYVIQECDFYIFFPGVGGDPQIEGFNKKYLKLDKITLKKLFTMKKNRWVLVCNRAPVYLLSSEELYLIKNKY